MWLEFHQQRRGSHFQRIYNLKHRYSFQFEKKNDNKVLLNIFDRDKFLFLTCDDLLPFSSVSSRNKGQPLCLICDNKDLDYPEWVCNL